MSLQGLHSMQVLLLLTALAVKNYEMCACVGCSKLIQKQENSVHSTSNSSVTRNEVLSGTRSCRRNPPWIAGFGIKQAV